MVVTSGSGRSYWRCAGVLLGETLSYVRTSVTNIMYLSSTSIPGWTGGIDPGVLDSALLRERDDGVLACPRKGHVPQPPLFVQAFQATNPTQTRRTKTGRVNEGREGITAVIDERGRMQVGCRASRQSGVSPKIQQGRNGREEQLDRKQYLVQEGAYHTSRPRDPRRRSLAKAGSFLRPSLARNSRTKNSR